jgi:hypothetical protein
MLTEKTRKILLNQKVISKESIYRSAIAKVSGLEADVIAKDMF